MLESYLRPPVQQYLLTPIAKFFYYRLGVSANATTGFAALTGLMIIPFLLKGQTIVAASLLLLSGLLDALDGSIARISDNSTQKGTMLDILSDRFVESCVFIGLFLVHPEQGFMILMMLAATMLCVTSFLLVGVFTKNDGTRGMYYSIGLIERLEAFVFFTLMILWPEGMMGLSIAYTALVLLTTAVRIDEFTA